jgi:hypothetical protein
MKLSDPGRDEKVIAEMTGYTFYHLLNKSRSAVEPTYAWLKPTFGT